ncbi:MAG: hypothetical protein QW666_00600 [Candidatus Woesearchaeota archaeon]
MVGDLIRKIALICILFILLSASTLGSPEFYCEKTIENNIILMHCLVSKQINNIISTVLNDYNSVSDARLLSKELSMMDPDFVSEFSRRINEPGMRKQVFDYLKEVKQAVKEF